jgi:hypothetical protein
MRKHFTKLVSSKIFAVKKAHINRPCEFRIEVDPIASRYKKADEAFHIIANRMLRRQFRGEEPIKSVVEKDSKESENIQISDFLLGAVMSAFQGDATSPAKLKVAEKIAKHLGWGSLGHDTKPNERKFNIWYFYDPTKGPREVETKDVLLKYPLPNRS